MGSTSIEWSDKTWQVTGGCERISPGCGGASGVGGCYAEKMAHRLELMGQADYAGLTRKTANGDVRWTGDVRPWPHRLEQPLSWKKPARIFVDSMSDLFHRSVPFEYIAAVYGYMAACPHHTFQVLTKRAERRRDWFGWMRVQRAGSRTHACMAALDAEREHHPDGDGGPLHVKHCADPDGAWPVPNVWEGVSVEDRKYGVPRIDALRDTPAAIRFLSCEPLLEDLGKLDLRGIDQVIAGAESGRGARPMNEDWVRSLRDQCAEQSVAFFLKQKLDPRGHKVSLPLLDGRQWAQMPGEKP